MKVSLFCDCSTYERAFPCAQQRSHVKKISVLFLTLIDEGIDWDDFTEVLIFCQKALNSHNDNAFRTIQPLFLTFDLKIDIAQDGSAVKRAEQPHCSRIFR